LSDCEKRDRIVLSPWAVASAWRQEGIFQWTGRAGFPGGRGKCKAGRLSILLFPDLMIIV
jgi:hypothetical protein